MATGNEITRENLKKHFWEDLLASVVVFLVALPLCMGIALASGFPAQSGIITGIVGGLIIGMFAGSPLQVSGPAAGLVVVVVELIQQHGIESIGIIIMIAGGIQLSAGQFGLGQWFRAVPPSVVHGMLSGIGLLLLSNQFHVMLDTTPKESSLENIITMPVAIWQELVTTDMNSHHVAALIGVSTILIMVLWNRIASGWFKHIPGALVAIVTVTAIDAGVGLDIKHVQLDGSLLDVVRFPGAQSFRNIASWELLVDAVAVAFIASCETMLTCTALDKIAVGHRSRYDQELSAQGIGNAICGFLGVPPMTGVIVRSGVNVKAGARTRLSTVLHGIWLLAFVSFLPFIVEKIPLAALAALLVRTGYTLLLSSEAKELKKHGSREVAIWAITLGSIVLIDLLTGVLIGIILSIINLLYIFSHLEIYVINDEKAKVTEIRLQGAATFLSLPKLAQILDHVPNDTEMHVHLEDLDYIDHACLELLVSWDKEHKAKGGSLVIDWGTLGAMYRERRRKLRSKPKKEKNLATPEPAGKEPDGQ